MKGKNVINIPLHVICVTYKSMALFRPGRMENTIAKVLALEVRYHKGTHICFYIAKRSFRFVFKAIEEGRYNFVFEIVARKR